jgi:predicted RNA-binding protein with RPS1 domain
VSEQEAVAHTTETPDADVVAAAAPDAEATEEVLTELPDAAVVPNNGSIVKGRVARLVDFGAFVDISDGQGGILTGLVHVSEVDAGFVENIYAHLAEGEITDVKVVSMGEDGKIGLSIKQADPNWAERSEEDRPRRSTIDKDFDRRLRKFMHNSQSIQGEARRQRRSRLGRDRM